MNQYETHTPAT